MIIRTEVDRFGQNFQCTVDFVNQRKLFSFSFSFLHFFPPQLDLIALFSRDVDWLITNPIAGVSLGPFADYKSKLFSGSAGELFEFADPESVVSKRYEDALRIALHYGVRVTYCGSIDDQLVSMEVCSDILTLFIR